MKHYAGLDVWAYRTLRRCCASQKLSISAGKPAPAVMFNSTTNPQPWCSASTALSAMSNEFRIFRPFYISLDNAYPNSRLRSTKSRLSAHEEADPRDWLVRPGRDALIVQTLSQGRGHATTLLALDVAGSDDDDI